MDPPVWKASYDALAGAYASYLVALGGVSITVLTLVLTIQQEDSEGEPLPRTATFRLFYTALIVATFACFVGAHLMTEASVLRAEGVPAGQGNVALFCLAAPNVYAAAALFAFSLVLLPLVYDRGIPLGAKRVAFATFATVGLGSALLAVLVTWVGQSFPGNPYAAGAALAAGAAVVAAECRRRSDPLGFALPFGLSAGVVLGSFVCFNLGINAWHGNPPAWFVAWVYALGGVLPGAAVTARGLTLFREKGRPAPAPGVEGRRVPV